jgi:hypothetical protein
MAFYRDNALIYRVLGNVAHVLQEETILRQYDMMAVSCLLRREKMLAVWTGV